MEVAYFLYQKLEYGCCLRGGEGSAGATEEWSRQKEKEWKDFLAAEINGLSWPEKSELTMLPLELSDCKLLRVTNTSDNLYRISEWWRKETQAQRVELDVRIFEVSNEALEAVGWFGKESLDADATQKALAKRNDVKELASPVIWTRMGEEAVYKSVMEYIYPTDFEVKTPEICCLHGEAGGEADDAPAKVNLTVVEPQSFTMREAGVIIDVTPTLDESGAMNIQLHLSVVGDPEWRDYGMTAIASNGEKYDLPMEQPLFPAFNLDTYIYAMPDSTVVTGGLYGKSVEGASAKFILVFLTPHIRSLRPTYNAETSVVTFD